MNKMIVCNQSIDRDLQSISRAKLFKIIFARKAWRICRALNRHLLAPGLVGLLLVASCTAFVPLAAAAVGGEFVISVKPGQEMRTLDAAWHASTGQFLVVWSEHPNMEIHCQLVNLDSTLSGGDYVISEGGGSYEDFPVVADAGNTNDPAQQVSLAVWMDDRDGALDIWAQLIAPAGSAKQGTNFKVSGAGTDLFPQLAYGQIDANNGHFLVVWEQEAAVGDSEVFGRLIRGATIAAGAKPGDFVGGSFQISGGTAGLSSAPHVAFDPINDNFLVVWTDDRGAPSGGLDIWGQRVNTNGALVGGSFQISSQTGTEYAPLIVYHPEQQEYLVVWDWESTLTTPSNVYAQRVSPGGALSGGVINVAVTAGQEEAGDPAIDVETGSYVIPLNTGPTIGDRNKVEIEKISATGTVLGVRQQVATDAEANKGPIAAAYGSTPIGPGAGVAAVSEILFAWRDARAAVAPDAGVYGRMVEVLSDTDGDGLMDTWENSGFVDMNDNGVLDAGDFDFSTLPAADRPNVNHKDLYVEVDWMQVDADNDGIVQNDPNSPGDHTHAPAAALGSAPTGTVLDEVITSFANAPVWNPDGTTGINLHIDTGAFGGGGPIAETLGADFFTGFEGVKAANFAPNRRRVFRYCLYKHEGSGRAEIWGNDFWVGGMYNTGVLQTVGFMHEFGHTLGLRHGGGDNINYKPNYLSIMSYSFSSTGLQPTLRMDYSSQVLITLDEANLNEATPLGDGNDHTGDGIEQTIFSAGGVTVGPNAQTAGNVGINWDNDGTAGESGAAVGNNNINNFGTPASPANEALIGFDDWANIRYNWGSSPHVDDNVHIFHQEDDLTEAMKDFARTLYGDPSLSMSKSGTMSGIPGDPVSYNIQIDNAGLGLARNILVQDTWSAGLTFTDSGTPTTLNVLNADGSRTLVWTINVLDSGNSVTITVNGIIDFPPIGDFVTNSVEVTGQNILGEAETPLSSTLITYIQFPEIEATKTATPSVNAGEAITYAVTYKNVGDGDAVDVVVTDKLPVDVYYSLALDQGAGPTPNTVTVNVDGTTTLTWLIGDVSSSSSVATIEYTARPSLLLIAGSSVSNDASLDFKDANGNNYPELTFSASTAITSVPPGRNPKSLGFVRTHKEWWSEEILARIQATDSRFDGAGTVPDGQLSAPEVKAVMASEGNQPKVLLMQLLTTYFNLATRQINADTAIKSRTASKLGLLNVHDAVVYAGNTLELPVNKLSRLRYSDATLILDEINCNKSEVYA